MKKDLPAKAEISATEKLLESIRGKQKPADLNSQTSPETRTESENRSSSSSAAFKHILGRKGVVIGVDIGPDDIRLVKIAGGLDRKPKLLDMRSIPFKSKKTGNFSEFLRASVLDFIGASKNAMIWGLMSSPNLELRHLRVPKVDKKQMFNAVFWTMKKETEFDERFIFDFEVQGEVIEKDIPKLSVLAYVVPGNDVEEARETFSRSGLSLAGITISPFLTQNLFRSGWLTYNKDFACLHIEDDISRIHIFSGGNLALTRVINTGLNSMADALLESLGRGRNAETEMNAAPPDAGTLNRQAARNILLGLAASPSGAPVQNAATEEAIFDAVSPVAERLARQIERTLEHYTRTTGSDITEKVYLSGLLQPWKRLVNYIGEQLGLSAETLDPLAPRTHILSRVIPPSNVGERVAYSTSLALALSENSITPNLLFPYAERQKLGKIRKTNQIIAAAAMVIMCLLGAAFFWQQRVIDTKKAELGSLKQQLAQYSPVLSKDLIARAAAKAKLQLQSLRDLSNDYLGLAVLSQISAITPPNIRLISVSVDLAGAGGEKPKPGTPDQPAQKTLILDGIILGDRPVLEAHLARYLTVLGLSPILVNPVVHSTNTEYYQDEGEVLHFILKIGLAANT